MVASSTLAQVAPAVDDLISGNIRTMPLQVAAATYVRGEVLALSGNVYGKLAAGTGNTAAAVMPFDVVVGAQTLMALYIEGDFNEERLFINGAVLADVKTALRKLGIMTRLWGAAPNVL